VATTIVATPAPSWDPLSKVLILEEVSRVVALLVVALPVVLTAVEVVVDARDIQRGLTALELAMLLGCTAPVGCEGLVLML